MIPMLQTHRLQSLNDLIAWKGGPIHGVPVANLQQEARAFILSAQTTTPDDRRLVGCHNWKGLTVHVCRSHQKTTRAIVGDLQFEPHRISFQVTWSEKSRKILKTVSPTMLLCAHSMWLNNDIVSDDSDDESHAPVRSILPPLWIDPAHEQIVALSWEESQALLATMKELNQLYAHLFQK